MLIFNASAVALHEMTYYLIASFVLVFIE